MKLIHRIVARAKGDDKRARACSAHGNFFCPICK